MKSVVPTSLSAQDVTHIVTAAGLGHGEFHECLPSTNDYTLQLSAQYTGPLPLAVIATQQTAGRGRGANQWWSAAGSLTLSLLLETAPQRLPQRLWPKASLVTGLAICQTLEPLLPAEQVRIKWPNDIWVRQRKVCGILVEPTRQGPQRLVIGIGLNVNNSTQHAPEELQSRAVALCDVAQRSFSVTEIAIAVLGNVIDRLSWLDTRDDELLRQWQQRCALTGREVAIDNDTRIVRGTCRRIDADGALLVETSTGMERCLSGVVTMIS